ncbi:hypothetical protein P4S93_03090 [Aneurinibacillus thermoaerophilus]|uniref:Uncharacterized protein n=1 Tax=Aneurinibacillus thermoaerophilus TaxID=143495 RepID=A0A1G7ZUK4_ANETH|nr:MULTISPECIES: hypothetical protein [Aneurinibacillus]MED0755906.1 hypothetical protein [Aneurinibacillus thermoaerophilus]MED0759770.1 hypothetical protein [Aneurinibacillus thermoaerophilus]SDH12368.1 hypothetical protein SAMN04489735_101263 [Aneurinibacillus thermoaerophilus]
MPELNDHVKTGFPYPPQDAAANERSLYEKYGWLPLTMTLIIGKWRA